MISVGLTVPHSPLLIPEIGKKEGDMASMEKTIQGMLKAGLLLNVYKPDVILFITAAGLTLPDKIGISIPRSSETLDCEFGEYEMEEKMSFEYDIELAEVIASKFPDTNFVEQTFLDYSLGIPLYYFSKAISNNFKVCHLNCSLFGAKKHFEIGKELYNCLNSQDKRIAVVVSGELGNLDSEIGSGFEDVVRSSMSEFKESFLLFDPFDLDEIGQSIYKPLSMYFGIFEGKALKNKELSYEAPYNIGLLCSQSVAID